MICRLNSSVYLLPLWAIVKHILSNKYFNVSHFSCPLIYTNITSCLSLLCFTPQLVQLSNINIIIIITNFLLYRSAIPFVPPFLLAVFLFCQLFPFYIIQRFSTYKCCSLLDLFVRHTKHKRIPNNTQIIINHY